MTEEESETVELSDVTVDISKDDISYLVKVSCERLDKVAVERFDSLSNMSDAIEKAKQAIGLDYRNLDEKTSRSLT